MGALSSNDLQWLDYKIGHQGSSPSNGHQGDTTYWSSTFLAMIYSFEHIHV